MNGTITLNDYANDRDNVVAHWASTGNPLGEDVPIGHPLFEDPMGLLDLSGTVGEDGEWRWNGEGRPTDYFGNSIRYLRARVDAEAWSSLAEEYENG